MGGNIMTGTISQESISRKLKSYGDDLIAITKDFKSGLDENHNIDRKIEFTVNNTPYAITWWCNQCYLKTGDILILFNDLEIANSWPHESKMNIQFHNNNDDCVCVIKIH
jgi:hypothetical protein